MKTPRFMLAAAVLFWGAQTGRIALAAPLALLLEAWHWTPVRWDIAPIGFQRVADLCTWIFLIAAGYLTFSIGLPVPVLKILQWLPVVLAPLLLAQLYSTAGRIELAALFMSLRSARSARLAQVQVDLAAPFVVVCALAAGAANARTPAYFAGVAALALGLLWCVRPRDRRIGVWVLAAAVATSLGYAGHLGLSRLQAIVVNYAIDYLNANLARTDPYQAATDIGHIGELKSSDRILLRVTLPPAARIPLLLHRASYDLYTNAVWLARDAPFDAMVPTGTAAEWVLAASPAPASTLIVRESMPQGRSVLSLPSGAVRIMGLAGSDMKRNRLGTVQVERQPGAARYAVRFADAVHPRDAPTPYDLRVPAPELPAVEQVVGALGLRAMNPADAMRALQRYFDERFRYSTYRAGRGGGATPLADFLLRSHSGHCEYFATATVLIARAAGIPARYATGFSVQEWSDLQSSYLVRERHAHAWARVYVDGAWRDIDTTPAQWFAEEAKQASTWEPVSDLWSWLAWQASAWRTGEDDESLPAWVLWALVPLVGVLAWRIYRSGGFVRRRRDGDAVSAASARPGADSDFYRIESRLAAMGLARLAHEPFGDWLERVGRTPAELQVETLRALLDLHYRYRFDPLGLDGSERHALAEGVERWLAAHRA